MYKVKIIYDDCFFESKIQSIPNQGDKIGFFNFNGFWQVKTVDYIVYKFDRQHRNSIIEIILCTDEIKKS